MGFKFENLPQHLNTYPASTFDNKRVVSPFELPNGRVIDDPFTEDEEVEMLRKLKVLLWVLLGFLLMLLFS